MDQTRIDQGIRLGQLIKALNLNQSSFAKGLGTTQPNINRMVNGDSNISMEVLNGITKKHIQVSLHWLLTGSGEMLLGEIPNKSPQISDFSGNWKRRLVELEERVKRLERVIEKAP